VIALTKTIIKTFENRVALATGRVSRGVCFALVGLIGCLCLTLSPASSAAQCATESLRTELHFAALPECRGYEMVSPPYKEGNTVLPVARSQDGTRMVYESLGVTGGAGSDYVLAPGAVYEAVRGPAEWVSAPIVPSAAVFPGYRYLDYGTTTGRSLWRLRKTPQTEEGEGPLYRRETGGSLVEVGPVEPSKPEAAQMEYMGASTDLTHVFFEIGTQDERRGLWLGDETNGGHPSLYEYVGRDNQEPKLVGVSNIGAVKKNTQAVQLGHCGVELGSAASSDTYNAISEDGKTVFFTVRSSGGTSCGKAVDELYARVNGETTVAISEPLLSVAGRECDGACREDEEVEAKRGEGEFQGASADGRKVFFLTNQSLLNSDKDNRRDLYEVDLQGGAVRSLTRVSLALSVTEPAEVRGVVRVSEDGSHVYFVAGGLLSGVPNANGEMAVAGADNMYVYEPDPEHSGQHEIAFIADLCSGANRSGSALQAKCHGSDAGDWALRDARPAQATPDGSAIVFSSTGDLTSDDRSASSQLFEYDAKRGSLTRVSMGEGGFADDGNTDNEAEAPELSVASYASAFEPRSHATVSLALSSDGSRVFFLSADALSPAAAPGTVNVYEYSNNDVRLISDGHDSGHVLSKAAVQFFGTDPSAQDALFTTTDQLIGQDLDSQQDLYDARIEGGFPPGKIAPRCTEEACRATSNVTPEAVGAAGSAVAQAGGNFPPKRRQVSRLRRHRRSKHHVRKRPSGDRHKAGRKRSPGRKRMR
jgi:hypothetical protein